MATPVFVFACLAYEADSHSKSCFFDVVEELFKKARINFLFRVPLKQALCYHGLGNLPATEATAAFVRQNNFYRNFSEEMYLKIFLPSKSSCKN